MSLEKDGTRHTSNAKNLVREGEARVGDPLVQLAWSTSRHPTVEMPAKRETMWVSGSTMLNFCERLAALSRSGEESPDGRRLKVASCPPLAGVGHPSRSGPWSVLSNGHPASRLRRSTERSALSSSLAFLSICHSLRRQRTSGRMERGEDIDRLFAVTGMRYRPIAPFGPRFSAFAENDRII